MKFKSVKKLVFFSVFRQNFAGLKYDSVFFIKTSAVKAVVKHLFFDWEQNTRKI